MSTAKFRQPKLVDVRKKTTERMSPKGVQSVVKIYAHLMFGEDLVRVCISERAASWARKEDGG